MELRLRAVSWRLWVLAAGLTLAGCPVKEEPCGQPEDRPGRDADRGATRVGAPGCLSGEFFVDTAEGVEAPCEDFRKALETALQDGFTPTGGGARLDGFARNACEWFPGDHCEQTCPKKGAGEATWGPPGSLKPVVTVEPALPEARDGLDQERRFFRVRFALTPVGGGDPVPVEFPDFSLCEVLDYIRQASDTVLADVCGQDPTVAQNACGEDTPSGHRLLVGRECPSLPADVAAHVSGSSDPLLNWHLKRMGFEAPPVEAPEKLPVEVALIDTGVDDALAGASALGIRRLETAGSMRFPDSGTGPRHRHGSAMATILASALPGVTITSIRALDENGLGTTAEVARAIDAATHMAGPDETRPLVMNLSLGWPAELSLPRSVRGKRWRMNARSGTWSALGNCAVVEDGIGETVKYTLAAARAEPDRPISIIGAAGNRPPGFDRKAAELGKAQSGFDCGGNDDLGGGENGNASLRRKWCNDNRGSGAFFYPALWGPEPARFNPRTAACELVRAVIPASAVDDQDRVAVTDPEKLQAALLAPGERVYASVPDWAGLPASAIQAPAAAPVCSGPGGDAELVLPQAYTGTSVSSVLVSAVAAHAQVLWTALPGAPEGPGTGKPLVRNELLRLLYATGAPVAPPRTSIDGVKVRMVSDCRLRTALSAGGDCTSALTACLGAATDDSKAPIDAALETCSEGLEMACGFVAACNEAGLPAAVGWPAAYVPPPGPSCEDVDVSLRTPAPTWVETGLPTCTGLDCGSVFDLGGLGPQPEIVTCPDCGWFVTIGTTGLTATGRLVFEIDPTIKAGTTFTAPYVYMYKTGRNFTLTIPTGTCTGCTDLSKWVPGARITLNNIAGPTLTSGDSFRNYQYKLYVKMKTPGQTATTDVTPLTAIFTP